MRIAGMQIQLSSILLFGCLLLAGAVSLTGVAPELLVQALLILGIALAGGSLLAVIYRIVRSKGRAPDALLQLEDNEAAGMSAPWSVGDALAVVIVAFLGGQLLGIGSVALVISFIDGTPLLTALARTESEVHLLFIGYLLAQLFALVGVYLFARYRRLRLRDFGFRKFKVGRAFSLMGLFFLGYLVVSTLVVGLLEFFDTGIDFQAQQEIGFLEAAASYEVMMAFVALVILAPFAEELLFRGILLPALSKTWGLVGAVAISSILFGLLHPPVNAMIGIGIFAVFLALIYVRTRSLWPAIMLHSVKNLIAFVAIFFAEDALRYLEELSFVIIGRGL